MDSISSPVSDPKSVQRRGPLFSPSAWIVFGAFLLAGLVLRSFYAGAWHENGLITFSDADCYTRLARIQHIDSTHWILRFHFWENYPQGIATHTTALFDALILIIQAPLQLFSKNALEWAGVVVSPLLYVLTAFFFFWWARSRQLTSSTLILGLWGLATLPSLVWATPFARPDHQSLLVALIFIALLAEYERWQNPRFWAPFAGAVWGLACWTSFYEPLVILILVVVTNLISRRKEQKELFLGFGAMMVLFLAVEHWHFAELPRDQWHYFRNWLGTIGETQPTSLQNFSIYFTPLVWLIPPAFLSLLFARSLNPYRILLIVLVILVTDLALWERRWFYFAGVVQLLFWVEWFQAERRAWMRPLFLAAFVLCSLWSFSQAGFGPREQSLTPQLKMIGEDIHAPGSILAPWWLSPELLYYSHQPIVASSSHESLAGTLDSARFFTTSNWTDAQRILTERKVHWVVVYEADRLLQNSREILLGKKVRVHENGNTVAERLWNITAVPTRFHLVAVTDSLRLYSYDAP